MTANSYAFTVGAMRCTVLLDGAAHVDAERMMRRFPAATEAEYRQAYADMGLSFDEADNALNVMLIETGAEVVLVDAGEGMSANGGHLLASMAHAGIAPQAVTLVILTHSHGDHVMGLLSEGQPTFPNARYVMSNAELGFWRGRINATTQPVLTMMQSHGLRTIAMDEVIVDGITAVPLPGHTPGQIGLEIASRGDVLLHMADLLHSPMQFAHPEWSAYFDADTSISVPTRRSALAAAANRGVLTMFYHITFPGLGRVQHGQQAYGWQAAQL